MPISLLKIFFVYSKLPAKWSEIVWIDPRKGGAIGMNILISLSLSSYSKRAIAVYACIVPRECPTITVRFPVNLLRFFRVV